jgi:hypothetical protein
MHRVHTYIFCGAPSTIARTFCTLGDQVLFALRLEWLTVFPEAIPLLQISQYFAISTNLSAEIKQ